MPRMLACFEKSSRILIVGVPPVVVLKVTIRPPALTAVMLPGKVACPTLSSDVHPRSPSVAALSRGASLSGVVDRHVRAEVRAC